VCHQPKEDVDFWPMFQRPDFALDFPRRGEIEIGLDGISLLDFECAPCGVSPMQDVLTLHDGNFPWIGHIVPGMKVHLCFDM